MTKTLNAGAIALALFMAPQMHSQQLNQRNGIQRVLLISIDGMHAVDFLNCAHGISTINHGAPYCPSLAALGKNGINYVAASTSKTSDSFPGLPRSSPEEARPLRASTTTWLIREISIHPRKPPATA